MSAYLVARAQLCPKGRFQPVIDRVQIASQPGSSFSPKVGKEVYFTVLAVEGDSHDLAREKILRTLDEHPIFAWCKPLLMR